MKYQLKSGRIVEKGDFVQVKLTDKTIKFFKELGLLKDYKEEDYSEFFLDDYFDIFNIFK